jgi:hypothetical protein
MAHFANIHNVISIMNVANIYEGNEVNEGTIKDPDIDIG